MRPPGPRAGRTGAAPGRGVTGLLFVATTVLWGSSAIVTGHQAVSGAPEVSVGYRMALVSLVMFAWCRATGASLAIGPRDRPWVAAQGVLFFGLAFITFYHATTLIPSGVAALILSTSSLVAAAVSRVFLGTPLRARVVAGLLCGVAGLGVVVTPQLADLAGRDGAPIGLLWAVGAAASAGCGTVVAARNQRAGLPIAAIMGWSALGGAAFAFAWALLAGAGFAVTLSPAYVAGLLYLAILASCVTFFMYFNLVARVGAGGAAYTLSAVPLVAIALSVAFEGLNIDLFILAGAAAILVGNVLVLASPPAAGRSTRRQPKDQAA